MDNIQSELKNLCGIVDSDDEITQNMRKDLKIWLRPKTRHTKQLQGSPRPTHFLCLSLLLVLAWSDLRQGFSRVFHCTE